MWKALPANGTSSNAGSKQSHVDRSPGRLLSGARMAIRSLSGGLGDSPLANHGSKDEAPPQYQGVATNGIRSSQRIHFEFLRTADPVFSNSTVARYDLAEVP